MFPVSVSGTISAEYTGSDLAADMWRGIRPEIERRGGAIVSQDEEALIFSNPVLSSALRSNWSLFTGVTGGEVRLRRGEPNVVVEYSFSLRRLALLGLLFCAGAFAVGPPAIIVVLVLFALNYVTASLRLPLAVNSWVRQVPGVLLRGS